MEEDFDNIYKAIWKWVIEDKLFHFGSQIDGKFTINDIVTGNDSGASGKITEIHKKFFKYDKIGNIDFTDETILSNTGVLSASKGINNFNNSIGNRVYLNEAPEEELKMVVPYCVYFYLKGTKIHSYNTEYRDMTFQWTIIDNQNSSSNIMKIYSQLEFLLKNGRYMPIEGYVTLDSLVEDEPLIGRDENKYWQCVIYNRLLVEKTN